MTFLHAVLLAPPLCRALRARDELVAYFQAGITEARQQLAAGQEPSGVLGRLISAEDEEGNRYVWSCPLLLFLASRVMRLVFALGVGGKFGVAGRARGALESAASGCVRRDLQY